MFGDVKNKQGCVVKEIRDLDSKDEVRLITKQEKDIRKKMVDEFGCLSRRHESL